MHFPQIKTTELSISNCRANPESPQESWLSIDVFFKVGGDLSKELSGAEEGFRHILAIVCPEKSEGGALSEQPLAEGADNSNDPTCPSLEVFPDVGDGFNAIRISAKLEKQNKSDRESIGAALAKALDVLSILGEIAAKGGSVTDLTTETLLAELSVQ